MTNKTDILIIEKLNKIIRKANWQIIEACLECYKLGRTDKVNFNMIHKQFCNSIYTRRINNKREIQK